MQATTDKFADVVSTMENSLETHKDKMAAVVQNSADQFDKVIKQNQTTVAGQMQATVEKFADAVATIKETLAALNKSMSEMKDANLNFALDAIDKIEKFNDKTEEVLKKISLALDGFNTDFQGELEKSMRDLKDNMAALLNENTRVAGEHGEHLAALLGKITEKMVEEYGKLADHIADIDRDIFERRAS